ncbi:MAG: Uma2 family endonuclease [Myxococcota bacterium]
MSVEEYIALDRSSEERWEYVDGRAIAMAGASPRHNAIVMNLTLTLGSALRGTKCFALGSDQKIEIVATGAFHYPDLSIVCGKPSPSERDSHAIINPLILVEVASPSTSDYDRGAKFDHYATIPELREMLVVFTETPRVEHRERSGDGRWIVTHLVGGEVGLSSIGVTLSIEEIYSDLERVEF